MSGADAPSSSGPSASASSTPPASSTAPASGPPAPIPSLAASAAPGAPPPGLLDRAVSALLLAVSAGALVRAFSGAEWAASAAIAALLAFCVLGRGLLKMRERLLLAVAIALTVAEVASGDRPGAVIWDALDRAAFLAAFMLLIGVLRDAAAPSGSVAASGRWLTRQPPGRRYGALGSGGHAMAVLLNVGALNLLAPLIQAGVQAGRDAGEPPDISAIKERRQFSALLRGFATAILWAPTTVTQAMLANLFPGADPWRVIGGGLGLAAVLGVAGYVEDRIRWAGVQRRAEAARAVAGQRRPDPPPIPRAALLDVGFVALALVGIAAAISALAGVAMVPALMLGAPLLTLGWMFSQALGGRGGPRAAPRAALAVTARRGAAILGRSIPASAPEAITLAVAGYMGAMLAALLPPDAVAAWTDSLPTLLLLALLPLGICLVVQAAITPIVFVVFVGNALGASGAMPADPALLILAMGAGWALALTCSPFAAAALVLGRVTGLAPADVTWRWNLGYSALAYPLAVGWLGLLLIMW
ncbi:MAG: hypothetical protein CML46_20915 [Rhodobacteraceae bacterium]|nr:hypothetical protein [Paracoccaceae bacterium]